MSRTFSLASQSRNQYVMMKVLLFSYILFPLIPSVNFSCNAYHVILMFKCENKHIGNSDILPCILTEEVAEGQRKF